MDAAGEVAGIELDADGVTVAVLGVDGEARVVPGADGEDRLPAAVVADGPERLVFGREALRAAVHEPEHAHLDLLDRLDGEGVTLRGRPWLSRALATRLLKRVREDWLAARREPPGPVVLAVPTSRGAAWRAAARAAVEDAGFRVGSSVDQLVAAAAGQPAGVRLLVVRLGGRDAEAGLVQRAGGHGALVGARARADLGRAAWARAAEGLLAEAWGDEGLEAPPGGVLRAAAGEALRLLGDRDRVTVPVEAGGRRIPLTLAAGPLQARTAPLRDGLLGLCDDVLDACGIGWTHLDAVLAVGVGLDVPGVREALAEAGPPVVVPPRPGLAVALGAARVAAVRHAPDHPGLTAEERIEARRMAPRRAPVEAPDEAGPPRGATVALADGGHDGS